MRIHSIIESSRVNGPGNRFVIWMQGCSIHCDGCANKALWDFSGGHEVPPEELLQKIPNDVDGISITGGEPLDQYADLMCFLRLVYPIKEVFLTSGYTLDVIKERFHEVLGFVDILVDGPFDKDKLDTTSAWRGSTNQGIHLLTERAQKYKDYKSEYGAEIILDADGNAIITGFGVPQFLKETL